ncbi:hypothetical protein [Allorhizocola rhizosphaerae]|uniref:hypothetical protein n=1 Tax=Allorhizocola rhizosphaerae TaxID=1872709 RepID=UPI000E3EA519|nr:hypothetical protein [Allorhizocola rhizosphaerae]
MTQPRRRGAGQPPESAVKALLSVFASVGLPVTVVSALMLYFGWARTNEQARYMGLHVSLFGYTGQDYILSSVSTLFVPLMALGVLGLGWLGLHQGILGWLAVPRKRPALRTAGRIAFVAGLATAACALLIAVVKRPATPMFIPLALAVGTAIAGYGLWLARAASPPSADRPLPVGHRALRALFIAGIIALALFWELSSLAAVVGRGHALRLASGVGSMPRATAFSGVPLGIDVPGVREERIDVDPPRWRTTGLRLLARSGGRIFLLHDGWTPVRGTVVVVPDGEGVSWQFSR